jgi:hypothetical protein
VLLAFLPFQAIDVVLQLLRFLDPDYIPYHVRAVHWIWAIEGATNHHHVESIIARSLTAPQAKYNYDAIEAFGVLWRLTGQLLTHLVCLFFVGLKHVLVKMILCFRGLG